jgi:mRNA-degrading endonuclease toxin of MazEF toxin-antitoxin module
VKRGDVYWADLVPRSGSEQTGRSQGKRGPTVIELLGGTAGLQKKSFAVCHQVTTLDRAKLAKRVGSLPSQLLREVEEGLKAAIDLD